MCFEAGQEDLARAPAEEAPGARALARRACCDAGRRWTRPCTDVRQRMAQNQSRLDAMREKMELLAREGVQASRTR